MTDEEIKDAIMDQRLRVLLGPPKEGASSFSKENITTDLILETFTPRQRAAMLLLAYELMSTCRQDASGSVMGTLEELLEVSFPEED